MVLLKSIGVRTSRAQRFETEGAPREVGAASTLLAQIELRERAVGEKTRRPKACDSVLYLLCVMVGLSS